LLTGAAADPDRVEPGAFCAAYIGIQIIADHDCFGRQEVPVRERKLENAWMRLAVTACGRREQEVKVLGNVKAPRQLLHILVVACIGDQTETVAILLEFLQGWQSILFEDPVRLCNGKQTIQGVAQDRFFNIAVAFISEQVAQDEGIGGLEQILFALPEILTEPFAKFTREGG
jgi:hypothetical protein